jgi:hypothetical protein
LIDQFTKLFDWEKTESQQEDFERSRKIFGKFLVEFMSAVGQNENEFLQLAYQIRVQDSESPDEPYLYTQIILQFVNDPFFERIILSNQWDKEKK